MPSWWRKVKDTVNLFHNTLSTVLVWTVPFPLGCFNSLLWRTSPDISVLFAKHFLPEFLFHKCLSFLWITSLLTAFLGVRGSFATKVSTAQRCATYRAQTCVECCNSTDPCGSILGFFFFKKKENSTTDSCNWKIRVFHLCSIVTHSLGKIIPVFCRFHPHLFFLIYFSNFSIFITSDSFPCQLISFFKKAKLL